MWVFFLKVVCDLPLFFFFSHAARGSVAALGVPIFSLGCEKKMHIFAVFFFASGFCYIPAAQRGVFVHSNFRFFFYITCENDFLLGSFTNGA